MSKYRHLFAPSIAPSDEVPEGTRFRLYPQPPYAGRVREPETIRVSSPAGSIGPGPGDHRMYVVNPVGKRRPYGIARGPNGSPFLYLPPWEGAVRRPAMPGPDGHFDHLEPGTPAFELAHVYGCVQFVLDVWEGYFGRPIRWHFAPDYARLEISLFPELDNATAGYGFMEVGADISEADAYRPFSLNFDVLAHEVGHLIIYGEIGVPSYGVPPGEVFGFHESAADVAALVAVLHFESVIDELLRRSRGNLYSFNELNRFGELSENEQIRFASNPSTMADFAAGWDDEHDLSQPLTGALFDIFVDLFHENLLERGLISAEVEDLADQLERHPEYEPLIQALFDEAYADDAGGFRAALIDARDLMGGYLAAIWSRLAPDALDYAEVGAALLAVDRERTSGRYQRLIRNDLGWRGIGALRAGPRLVAPDAASHAISARTLTPRVGRYLPRLSYRERWAMSR